MMAAGHMRLFMLKALVLGKLHEYRNKYSVEKSDSVSSTTFT